jgi:mutator protein MutT
MAKDNEVHFVGQIAQKALIENAEGKILLVQYPEGDRAAGKWDLPGGRLNMGETTKEGLKREVKEEIGVDIEIVGILGTGLSLVSHELKLFVVVHQCKLVDPTAALTPEPGEIGRLEWRDKKDILSLPMINEVYKGVLFGNK